jgi:toxin ParE1/3/4
VKPLVVHREAKAEVRNAAAYYEGQRKGLGREFRLALKDAFERIQRNPQVTAAIDAQGTRKRRLSRFPYTVYYVELDDSIWIAAVAHQKRRPGYWSGRQP